MKESIRMEEKSLEAFIVEVFTRMKVKESIASLGARSLLDASLMGIDTHGVEALDMYVAHIIGGGLDANIEPIRVEGRGNVELWDMQNGMGLSGARMLMEHAICEANDKGIHFATCRNANHLGACGVYAKMAADAGMIGLVSQQALATLSPWGGRDPRIGASPFACSAPVADSFPFLFDAGMAAITRSKVKAYRRKGVPLPKGVALDAQGEPTEDPDKAWAGQLVPVGNHKGVGLAMVFEVLSSILSGNKMSNEITSIVDNSDQSAESGIFVIAINPAAVMPIIDFARSMREYVEYIESSSPRNPDDPPHYPGRRVGENWWDRKRNGIPVSVDALKRFGEIAVSLSVQSIHVP